VRSSSLLLSGLFREFGKSRVARCSVFSIPVSARKAPVRPLSTVRDALCPATVARNVPTAGRLLPVHPTAIAPSRLPASSFARCTRSLVHGETVGLATLVRCDVPALTRFARENLARYSGVTRAPQRGCARSIRAGTATAGAVRAYSRPGGEALGVPGGRRTSVTFGQPGWRGPGGLRKSRGDFRAAEGASLPRRTRRARSPDGGAVWLSSGGARGPAEVPSALPERREASLAARSTRVRGREHRARLASGELTSGRSSICATASERGRAQRGATHRRTGAGRRRRSTVFESRATRTRSVW